MCSAVDRNGGGVAMIKWRGTPGHFIGANNCCFHLTTDVNGTHRVSTVGCYHPLGIKSKRAVEIGLGRKFETMVFALGPDGEIADLSELECTGYNDDDAANAGHAETVERYASMKQRRRRVQ